MEVIHKATTDHGDQIAINNVHNLQLGQYHQLITIKVIRAHIKSNILSFEQPI